ncbi:MAG: hypothetical protein AAF720_12800 [Pseudomonadota bacterium]
MEQKKNKTISIAAAVRHEYGVQMWCEKCRRNKHLEPDELIALALSAFRMDELENKLKCKGCGAKEFSSFLSSPKGQCASYGVKDYVNLRKNENE